MAEDEINKPSGGRRPAKKKTTRAKKTLTKPAPASVDQDPGNNSAPATPVTRSAGSNKSSMVAWFALVLGVVSMGTGGYAWYQGAVDSKLNAGQQEARLNQQLSQVEQRIGQRIDGVLQAQTDQSADINAGVNELADTLARADTDMREQIRDIRGEIVNQSDSIRERTQAEIDLLSGRIEALRSQLDSDLDRWVVEEVEQLVLIAWQRLQFTGETDLAKQALQLADQRLKLLPGADVSEVRRLLSSDIAALDGIVPVDVPGLLNELSLLFEQIDRLPLAGDIVLDASTDSDEDREGVDEPQPQGAGSQENAGESMALERYLKPVIDAGAALLETLGDLVQIEKDGNPIKPVISAQIREMTYQRARLILESAQVALVRQDSGLYNHRIDAAREWVVQNFNRDAVLTRDWIEKLNQIGASYQDSRIPDISTTLSAVRALGENDPVL